MDRGFAGLLETKYLSGNQITETGLGPREEIQRNQLK